jgi:diaminopimelate epimerase
MDYRNADGSFAEMCGNGARVFLRYLQLLGLVGAKANIATRGGVRRAWLEEDGQITVEMGTAQLLAAAPTVTPYGASVAFTGVALELPNPHVVVLVASTDALAELDLTRSPAVEPPLPYGQNVEFVVRVGPRHLVMRVHERGVGETRSCGTGICAAVVAVAGGAEVNTGGDDTGWQVDVPGGSCHVRWQAGGELLLTGPAVLVGSVELSEQWLMTAGR